MFKDQIILIADPRITSIPIIENNEPMIDLRDQFTINYFERRYNSDYTKIRKSVYEKLLKAQNLLPEKLKLCIYEGYRSLKRQNSLFQERFRQNIKLYKDLDFKEVFYETVKLVSPVRNFDGSENIPPHSTGGAIDIYLIDNQGTLIDMGIHPEDAYLDTTGEVILTNSENISTNAKNNRKIMSEAMIKAGFINYATEYWHWSYGDRYWAYHVEQKHAIYGLADFIKN